MGADRLMAVVEWNQPSALALVGLALERGMKDAGEIMVAEAESVLSVPYPPASAPGSPPRRRTGVLATSHVANVERRASEVRLRVGVPSGSPAAARAAALAKGTRKMAARPWLPVVARNSRSMVRDTVVAALRRAL